MENFNDIQKTRSSYLTPCPYGDKLLLYHDGGMKENDGEILRRHLKGCKQCQRESLDLVRLSKTFTKFIPEIRPSKDLQEGMEEELKNLLEKYFEEKQALKQETKTQVLARVGRDLGRTLISWPMLKTYALGLSFYFVLKMIFKM